MEKHKLPCSFGTQLDKNDSKVYASPFTEVQIVVSWSMTSHGETLMRN